MEERVVLKTARVAGHGHALSIPRYRPNGEEHASYMLIHVPPPPPFFFSFSRLTFFFTHTYLRLKYVRLLRHLSFTPRTGGNISKPLAF